MAAKIKITHPQSGKGDGWAWGIAILTIYLGKESKALTPPCFLNSGPGLLPTHFYSPGWRGK